MNPEPGQGLAGFNWTMPPLSDNEFSQFRRMLYDRTGISLNESKKPLVSGRLMNRLRHHNVRSFAQYYKLTSEDASEFQIMIDLLTTNETRFFREPAHLDFFSNTIRSWKLKNQLPGVVRVWSAASSSGEEPYSIAFLAAEILGTGIATFEILGSDISARILEKAENARYNMDRATGIPDHFLKRYCLKGVKSNSGIFKIAPEITRHVTFKAINLTEEIPDIGLFDFIFLRNVMIYFDEGTRKQVVGRLVQKLKPHGFLIIGTAETLMGVSDKLISVEPNIYRRIQP